MCLVLLQVKRRACAIFSTKLFACKIMINWGGLVWVNFLFFIFLSSSFKVVVFVRRVSSDLELNPENWNH